MKWLILVLILLSVVIIIPPIAYHYIYPTAGDDTASHLIYFQSSLVNPLYPGQFFVAKLLNWLPFPLTTSFLWFHFVALIIIVWTVGLTVGFAVSPVAGILSALLVFGFSEALNLFYYGQIFDLVGIGILLPFWVICVSNMFEKKPFLQGLIWSVLEGFFLVLFAIFHANGVYIFALVPIIMAYYLVRNKVSKKLFGEVKELWENSFLMPLAFLSLVLVALAVVRVSPDPSRLLMDASILGAIFLGGALGIFVKERRRWVYGAVALATIVIIPSLTVWFQNNSAVKDADKGAIVYLNSLQGATFTASPNVAEEIYQQFVTKKFVDDEKWGDVDYMVLRSIPMTPQSDPDAYYFRNFGRGADSGVMEKYGFRLLQKFDAGERDRITGIPIIVGVYGRGK